MNRNDIWKPCLLGCFTFGIMAFGGIYIQSSFCDMLKYTRDQCDNTFAIQYLLLGILVLVAAALGIMAVISLIFSGELEKKEDEKK